MISESIEKSVYSYISYSTLHFFLASIFKENLPNANFLITGNTNSVFSS